MDPMDPSALTTAQLLREIASLEKQLTQRMDAVEKAVEVAHENLVRVPTEVDKSMGHLRDEVAQKFITVDVKFEGIQTQFAERDGRVEQTARITSERRAEASNAALRSLTESKEAMNKRFDIAESQAHGLDERVRMLMPRSESEALHRSHESRITQTFERLNERDNRAKGLSQGGAILAAGVAIIGTIIATVIGLVAYFSK